MINLDTKERYANFFTDYMFKKLFGTEGNKELLLSFLNALFENREVFKDIIYFSDEQIGEEACKRTSVYDLCCENDKGEKILVELQKSEQIFFIDRSIYYSTFPIQNQAPKSRWKFSLDKIYVIGILNITFDENNPDYFHHDVMLMDVNKKTIFYDKLSYIYLEIPKFNLTESELTTSLDKWLYVIKNINTLTEIPESLCEDEIFKRFFRQAEVAYLSSTELEEYKESQQDYWDMYSIIENAVDKGVKRGISIGEERGRIEGEERGIAIGEERQSLANIARMRARGYGNNLIAELLDLDINFVRSH